MAVVTDLKVPNSVRRGSDPVRKQLRGSSLLLMGRFLSRGINFLTQLLIVRTLTTQDYGAFAYGLAVVAFWEGLSSFGLHKAITRFVPIYHERRQRGLVVGAILLTTGAILVTSFIAVGLVHLAPDLLARLVNERGPMDLLLVLIFLVPVESIDHLLLGLFASFARPKAIFFRKHVLAPLLKLAVVLLLIGWQADVQFLAQGYVLASAVGVGIYIVFFARLFRHEGILQDLQRSDVQIPYREMFAFTLPLLSSGLVPVVLHSTATMILAYFHPATEVARYRAILPAAHLNNIVLASFGTLFTPTAARLFARGDSDGIRSLYWRTAVWMAVLSFPVFALTFSLAKSLTVTLYGDRYADSWMMLQWVSLAYYFSTALGNNGLTLKVLKRLRYVVAINFLAMAANVVLTFLLVPRYGALGTGLATALAIALHNLMKQAGLRAVGIGMFERRTLPVYAAILAGAAGLFLLQLVVDHFLILLAAAAVVSVLVLAFTKHELAVEDTFPELLRLPLVGTFLRSKTPRPFNRRSS